MPGQGSGSLAFYDFPAEHWQHVRSANPIESTFATVRLRTDKTKGCLSCETGLALVFKLAKSAERHWRRLDGANLIEGVKFRDGEAIQDAEEQAAACARTPNLTIAPTGWLSLRNSAAMQRQRPTSRMAAYAYFYMLMRPRNARRRSDDRLDHRGRRGHTEVCS